MTKEEKRRERSERRALQTQPSRPRVPKGPTECFGLGWQYPHRPGSVEQCVDCGDYNAGNQAPT